MQDDRIGLTETVTVESPPWLTLQSPQTTSVPAWSWYDEHATPRTETDPWAVNVHTDHETEHHHFELSRNWQELAAAGLMGSPIRLPTVAAGVPAGYADRA